jgi:hypothetical protein
VRQRDGETGPPHGGSGGHANGAHKRLPSPPPPRLAEHSICACQCCLWRVFAVVERPSSCRHSNNCHEVLLGLQAHLDVMRQSVIECAPRRWDDMLRMQSRLCACRRSGRSNFDVAPDEDGRAQPDTVRVADKRDGKPPRGRVNRWEADGAASLPGPPPPPPQRAGAWLRWPD